MTQAAADSTAGEQRDYFSLFDLPRQPEIDATDLSGRKRKLLGHFHPDRFVAASPAEKRMAASLAAEINEGYTTLADPVRRAGYLVEAAGVDVKAAERAPMPPSFLMQQMELREQVDSWSALAPEDREQIAADTDALFAKQWATFCEAWHAGRAADAASAWVALQYVDKLRREIANRTQD